MFIPDPESRIRIFPSLIQGKKDSGSRIRIKEFKYFQLKKLCLSFRKWDPGYSSRIRNPDPDLDILPIPDAPDPGVKKAPDPDPQHCL